MKASVTLGPLAVTPICLGTMTFGEQVDEPASHAILDRALERGLNFIDTAEMYPVPPKAETYSVTESIIGRWLAARPGMRDRIVLATKVAGPARGMAWMRGGKSDVTPADIEQACHDSLRRLNTDVIDLYQLHWPNRNTPSFGSIYFDPAKEQPQTPIDDQLRAFVLHADAGTKILRDPPELSGLEADGIAHERRRLRGDARLVQPLQQFITADRPTGGSHGRLG